MRRTDHLATGSGQHPPLVLYAAVAVTGAAVMMLELLGTRIIGPFYGVSLYVWASLIAVTLIALALGYFLGGHLADRYPTVQLAHIILLAALATVAIPFLTGPTLRMTDGLGLRAGAFVSASVLFTMPLTALAMVGPHVVKRAAGNLSQVGTAAGSVYAVSTVGSVVGTLLLGFYLLPRFGTRTILFSLGILLTGVALTVARHDRRLNAPFRSLWPFAIIALTIGSGSITGIATRPQSTEGFTIQSEAESLYGWVRVVDDTRRGVRLMLSDASVISAVDLEQGRSVLGYQQVLSLLPLIHPSGSPALLIGLGGGHVAQALNRHGIAVDTIEIDPAVADAAQRHFHFEPTGRFLVGDARYEIKHLAARYDLIIHDCFTGGTEPTHLLTRETLGELQARLTDRGLLALNYVGFKTGEGSEAVAAVHRTLRDVFPYVRTFVTNKNEFTDFIFLASLQPLAIDLHSHDRRLQWLLDHEHRFTEELGIVLTDEHNPLESRQVRKAETYRKIFLDRLAFDLLVR